MNLLFDERGRVPLGGVFASLLGDAAETGFAVARLNIAAVDLRLADMPALQRGRILVGRLDARSLPRRTDLSNLLELVDSGRFEIRSSGICNWSPDFSWFRGGSSDSALVGAHYLRNPVADAGPSFTCLVSHPAAVTRLTQRFDEMWRLGYDVRDAVTDMIRRAREDP